MSKSPFEQGLSVTEAVVTADLQIPTSAANRTDHFRISAKDNAKPATGFLFRTAKLSPQMHGTDDIDFQKSPKIPESLVL